MKKKTGKGMAGIKSKVLRQIASEIKEAGGVRPSGVYYAKAEHLKSHHSKGERPIYSKGNFIKN